MSPSIIPTLYPRFVIFDARREVTRDFPTPPFPLTTPITLVMDADLILVLKNGKIVERGKHQDLLDQDGWYAEMWRKQELQAKVGELDG